jgi:hypothetical protein
LWITFDEILLTHVGAPVAWGPRIIDTADTAVATPLRLIYRVTNEKPLTLYLAYFLSDLNKCTSNEIILKTLQYQLNKKQSCVQFLTDEHQLLFFK